MEYKSKLVIAGAALGAYIAARSFVNFLGFIDVPGGFRGKNGSFGKNGAARNSIAAVTAGILAQRLYGESDFKLDLRKDYYPDAQIKGKTTSDSIDTSVDLAFSGVNFDAEKNTDGKLEGKVNKSEFN